MEIVNFTLVTPFNISLTEQEHKLIQIFNDSLYQDILALTGSPVPLHSLSQEIGQLRDIQQHRLQTAVRSHYALSISSAVIIIIVCIILCTCYVKRVLNENRDTTGRPLSRKPLRNFFTDYREYRPTQNREYRQFREGLATSTHTTVSYTPAAEPTPDSEIQIVQLPAPRKITSDRPNPRQ